MHERLVGDLVGWLVGGLVGWLVGDLVVGWLTIWLIGWRIGWLVIYNIKNDFYFLNLHFCIMHRFLILFICFKYNAQQIKHTCMTM